MYMYRMKPTNLKLGSRPLGVYSLGCRSQMILYGLGFGAKHLGFDGLKFSTNPKP